MDKSGETGFCRGLKSRVFQGIDFWGGPNDKDYREGVTLIARLIDPRIGPQENRFKTNQGIPQL